MGDGETPRPEATGAPPLSRSAERSVPRSVDLAASLLFVAGGLAALSGTIALTFRPLLGAFTLALGGGQVLVGLRLRQLVPWARTAGFAVAALGLLDGLISYRTPVSLLIGVGLNGWLIYVLCRPDAIATFPSASVPTDLRAIRDVWPSRRGRRPQSRMRGRVRP